MSLIAKRAYRKGWTMDHPDVVKVLHFMRMPPKGAMDAYNDNPDAFGVSEIDNSAAGMVLESRGDASNIVRASAADLELEVRQVHKGMFTSH